MKIQHALPLLAVSLLTLSGCASNPDQTAITMAQIRATDINSKGPYPNIDQYQIMKAKAVNTQVEMTILYGGMGKTVPAVAIKNTARNYCQNKAIQTFFNDGLSYKLKIISMKGRTLAEQIVDRAYCQQLK